MLPSATLLATTLEQLIKRHYKLFYVAAIWYLSLVWTVAHNFKNAHRIFDISSAMALYALAASLWISYRVLGKDIRLFALAAFSTLVHFVFLLQQQPQGYTYDVGAHMATITHFGQHFWLQPIPMGGEAHQPPLYYMLSGFLYWFTSFFSVAKEYDARISLSCLNFLFFSVFMLYGIRMITQSIHTPFIKWLGITALLFWPANLLHSFRISNDILLYLSFTGCIYHFLNWWRTSSTTELKRTILWMAVAFGTKNSALLLPVMIAPMIAQKYCHGRKPKLWLKQLQSAACDQPWKALRLPLLALMICMALGLGRNVIHAYTGGNASAFEGKSGAPSTFIYQPALIEFNLKAFASFPFTYHPEDNSSLFWHMYLKSMNFGEYRWNGLQNAFLLNMSLLAMWGWLGAMLALQIARRKCPPATIITAVFVAQCVLATALMRMYANGFPAWADTRHLYVVVVFFLLAYLSLLESLREKYRTLYLVGVFWLADHTLLSLNHTLFQLTYGLPLPVLAGS